jgi:ubiquinone/menaquinone biosynthesis C-methylase UbiE
MCIKVRLYSLFIIKFTKIKMPKSFDYKTKMALGYDQAADYYDEWIGNMDSWRYSWLLQDLQFPPNPTVLDVGCGTGLTTFKVLEHCNGHGQFVGIDISPGMIEQAKAATEFQGVSNCVFVVGDAETLDYPDDYFDVVFSNSVFHWFVNKLSALKEMHRVLKPGGQVALRFNGGDFMKEVFEIAIRLEDQYPEFTMTPSWKEMKQYHSMSLETVHELFDHARFYDTKIYSRKDIGYYNVTKTMWLNNAAWQFWQIGFSQELREQFAQKAVAEAQKTSTDKGFKSTQEIIVAFGVKAQ